MVETFRSTRDVILRTEAWDQATTFYGSVLGLPVSYRSDHLVGFETGSFCLYVERGEGHGPVFEFLVDDVRAARARLVRRVARLWKKMRPCPVAISATPTASSSICAPAEVAFASGGAGGAGYAGVIGSHRWGYDRAVRGAQAWRSRTGCAPT